MKTQKNILVALLLNLSFAVMELIGGIVTGSVAILSDALHDLGDAVSIGLSWSLERKSRKNPDALYTYGYGRYSALGAAVTNAILLLGSVVVAWHGIERLFNSQPIRENGMLVMAVFGVTVNILAAYVTRGGGSLNQKAVNLHMLEDVLGWAVVLVGAVLIKLTGIVQIDALLSIGVAVFIFVEALRGMGAVLDLFLEKTPRDIDLQELTAHLSNLPRVQEVHHLHVWSLDGQNHCATVHVVTDATAAASVKMVVRQELQSHGITHATVEIEQPGEDCPHRRCRTLNICSQGGHHHHHHH